MTDFDEIESMFPPHKGGLILEHNPHHGMYESASLWIAESDHVDWESEESKQAAIDADSIWTLQWYQNTPVGFIAVAAPTLADLIRFACEDDNDSL